MDVGKQLLIAVAIYVLSAVVIELVLWYFNPSFSEYLRTVIIASPILVSIILTKLIVERLKSKRNY